MLKAPNGWPEIKDFYGWSEHYMGDLANWEGLMVLVPPPAGQVFTYDGRPCRGIRVHPKIAEELKVCLAQAAAAGLWEFVKATGGGYNFRAQRGSSKLSMHSLGAAIDIDPENNPLGIKPEHTLLGRDRGLLVVEIFESRGWTWGGRWARPDSMHLQWGRGF